MTIYRLTWYNPLLDPANVHTPEMAAAIDYGYYTDGTEVHGGPLLPPTEEHPFNLVSSLCDDGLHRPALDVDIAYNEDNLERIHVRFDDVTLTARAMRSASGNCHVYLDRPAMTWEQYVGYMRDVTLEGWIEGKYYRHSVSRGQSLLRAPGVPKLWQARRDEPAGALV